MQQCPKCGIRFRPEEKALWCPVRDCSTTEQRRPTEQQEVELKIKEEA